MLILYYESKKQLKSKIGCPLEYSETAIVGKEFKRDGEVFGSNRPHITGLGREFFAKVTMCDGLIAKVD